MPVAVVAWDADREWYDIRAISPGEQLPGLTMARRQFGTIVIDQLNRWAMHQAVPYAEGPLPPWNAAFWSAASEVLTTAIRVDTPRALDPQLDMSASLEALFEAVVQPSQSSTQAAQRIDGAVSGALGEYSGFFESRQEVGAFGGAKEQVLKRASGVSGDVIVEGVNLAATRARRDADALVSRLLRIRAVHGSRPLSIVIGYIASPGGLNGETHMRDWIREKVTDDIFDLVTQQHLFQIHAASSLHQIGVMTSQDSNEFGFD